MPNISKQARSKLHNARKVVILAGAGMSAELGIPTYYTGAQSLYGNTMSPFGYTDFEHAQEYLWQTDKESQIKYFNDSWKSLLTIDPQGEDSPYTELFDFLKENNKEYFVVTTNVDSSFVRSGYSVNSIFEVHGSYRLSQCVSTPDHGIFPTGNPELGYTICPVCHNDSRPNTLFFMDFQFNADYINFQQQRFLNFINEANAADTIVIEIGAGETVNTLRELSYKLGQVYDFPVVRINPDPEEFKPADFSICMTAKKALRYLL